MIGIEATARGIAPALTGRFSPAPPHIGLRNGRA